VLSSFARGAAVGQAVVVAVWESVGGLGGFKDLVNASLLMVRLFLCSALNF
jgi:hypothetical protein